MTAEKVSLTLDQELVAAARAAVGPRGLSSYVNEALRRQLQRDRIAAYLDGIDQEVGPIDEGIMQKVRREWPEKRSRRRTSA